jgi:hypothetical protein
MPRHSALRPALDAHERSGDGTERTIEFLGIFQAHRPFLSAPLEEERDEIKRLFASTTTFIVLPIERLFFFDKLFELCGAGDSLIRS